MRQSWDVELCLLNEELGLVNFLRLRDLAASRDYAQGILFGGQGRSGNDSPRQGQRINGLPCKWLSKAGGQQEKGFKQPHDQY